MPLISININGRNYDMACGEGQEAHLRGLAGRVSDRVTQLAKANGPIDEARLVVMAAILLADDLQVAQTQHAEAQQRFENAQAALAQTPEDAEGNMDRATAYLADVIDDVSARLEKVATRIET